MAITLKTPSIVRIPDRAALWTVNAVTADASGTEVIKAAGAAGVQHYIKKLIVICDAAIAVTLGDGEDTSAVETIWWGPLPFAAGTGNVVVFDYGPESAVILTAAKEFTVDASGAGNLCIWAEGATL